MPDDRCRITVIGDRRETDVAVPAQAPVGEYAPRLAQLCGQQSNGGLPPVWSLALAGGAAVPVTHSLSEAGILDGQRLYLRDLAAGEADGPLVRDVTEIVSDAHQRRGRLTPGARAAVAAALGLAWLLAAVAYLLSHRSSLGGAGAAGGLASAGVVLPAAMWVLRRRHSPPPGLLSVAVALAAIPCLAGAGALLSASSGGMTVSVAFGASLGALVAFAAVPDGITLAVSPVITIAAVTACALAASHAGTAVSAAIVTVIASMLVALAPWAAATITGSSVCTPPGTAWNADGVGDMLTTTTRLLAVLTAMPAAAIVGSLIVLARSASVFALALAIVAAAALIARAVEAVFTAQAIPLGAAGLAGMFAVCAGGPGRLPLAAGWPAPVIVAIGIAIVLAGAWLVTATVPPPEAAQPALTPRRSVPEVIRLVCNLALVPLALGLSGVYHQLMLLGGHL